MRVRWRQIGLRGMMAGVAALALVSTAVKETAIWYEKRKFIEFHEWRAQLFVDRAGPYRSLRPEIYEEYRLLAAWHAERAAMYRRARTVYFSEEGGEDIRQTMREQDYEKALTARPVGGRAAAPP